MYAHARLVLPASSHVEMLRVNLDHSNLSGEDVNGMSFQGADEELLRRALAILEDQGKCTMFKGESSSEDGIKFF